MRLRGKSIEELNVLRESIENEPRNQISGFNKYTPSARKRLALIAWAMTNLIERKKLEGDHEAI